ncbi:MAG TPA: tyrosine-protein phosphatase [Gammaproteobacteria bacterium]|jgi:protein-tyrosine phosphatase|nr:tyrosine-protein phosphatase [Gammaproteobacteria bacterium]|tara:strand:- start:418 stop:1236 length:819 start_codon:yes stop_codon:yes gene_type:complete
MTVHEDPSIRSFIEERLLPLSGGRNFRDLGGFKTEDGGRVRWGQLFRSATLTYLTDQDYEYLAHLKITTVCDLRDSKERRVEPTNWRAEPSPGFVTWNYTAKSTNHFSNSSPNENVEPGQVRERLLQSYPNMWSKHALHFAGVFAELADGNTPLVFHCFSGKDRTGLCAALILTALGVERDQVLRDYALSEHCVDYMAIYTDPDDSNQLAPYPYLAGLPPHLLAVALRSDPDYLESAFQHLETEYGSVMGYVRKELGVTQNKLETIRRNLLK